MRRRSPDSKRTAALAKLLAGIDARSFFEREENGIIKGLRPRPWSCRHAECSTMERFYLRGGGPRRRRTITVPPAPWILMAAEALRTLHPEPQFPLRAALAWRFGISIEAVRKALKAARRTR